MYSDVSRNSKLSHHVLHQNNSAEDHHFRISNPEDVYSNISGVPRTHKSIEALTSYKIPIIKRRPDAGNPYGDEGRERHECSPLATVEVYPGVRETIKDM